MATTAVTTAKPNLPSAEAIERALIRGDLGGLNEEQRLSYARTVCESIGLNILTQPLEYMTLNGKLVLYVKRSGTDQLRSIHKISVTITSREKIGDVYVVTAQAKAPDGRQDESTGAVSLGKMSGDALANLYMKAETKAKRRVTLSICGLGLLDESEVETIPQAKKVEASVDSKPRQTLEEANAIAAKHGLPPVTDTAPAAEGMQPGTRPPTEKQLERLWAIAKAANWPRIEVKKFCENKWAVSSSKDLNRMQYAELCDFILKNPMPAPAKKADPNDPPPPPPEAKNVPAPEVPF